MTTQTLTIAEFLLARIAEDEAEARRAAAFPWLSPSDAPWESARLLIEHGVGTPSTAHIARHNPARILAECEAKRRIVELHAVAPNGYKALLTEALCALASVYADHEDYRQEWKP